VGQCLLVYRSPLLPATSAKPKYVVTECVHVAFEVRVAVAYLSQLSDVVLLICVPLIRAALCKFTDKGGSACFPELGSGLRVRRYGCV
jgi:hypothetical protein